MKIITYNVNGLRAAVSKGLPEWLAQENPDILCLKLWAISLISILRRRRDIAVWQSSQSRSPTMWNMVWE